MANFKEIIKESFIEVLQFFKAIILPWIAFIFFIIGHDYSANANGWEHLITIILYTIAFAIINIYGMRYYNLHKYVIKKQTLDIVYDKKTNKLYTLSNDTIDSIVDINADTTEDLWGDETGSQKLEVIKSVYKSKLF
jgi:hypothetical protein